MANWWERKAQQVVQKNPYTQQNPYAGLYKSQAPTTWTADGKTYIGWQNAPNAKEGYTYWTQTGNKGYDTLRAQWLTAMNQYGQNSPEAEQYYRQLQSMSLADPSIADPAAKPQQTTFPGADWVKDIMSSATRNLAQQQASTLAQAQRHGAAQIGASNMLNPNAALNTIGSQVRAPFTQQFANIQTAGLQAQTQAEQDKARFEEMARQAQTQEQMNWINMMFNQSMAQRQLALQQQAQQVGWEDILGLVLGGAGSYFGGRR